MSDNENSKNIALSTTLFALLTSIIGSVLTIGSYLPFEPVLGAFLFFTMVGIGDLVLLYRSGFKLNKDFFSITLIVCYFLLTLGFIINTKEHSINIFLLLILFPIMNLSLTSNLLKEHFIIRYLLNGLYYIAGKFIGLFSYLKELTEAISLKVSANNPSKINTKLTTDLVKTLALFVIIGLPVIILIVALLSSSNDAFGNTISQIFSFNFDAGVNFSRFIFVAIVSLYLITDIYFLKEAKKTEKSLSVSITTQDLNTSKLLLRTGALTLIVINVFYVFFCFSEIGYDFSNARGLLLERGLHSYSEFAVGRFWELIVVSLINLGIFYVLTGSFKKLTKDNSKYLRNILIGNFVILFINSLGLILSVNARLSLYESGYGFTDKRLFSHAFAFMLLIVFVLFIVAIFKKNYVKYQLGAMAIMTLFFCLYTALPTTYIISKVNYDLAKADKIDEYDPFYNEDDLTMYDCLTYPASTYNPTTKQYEYKPCCEAISTESLPIAKQTLREGKITLSTEEKECLEQNINQFKHNYDDIARTIRAYSPIEALIRESLKN
jgi:hypothetical protein